MKHISLVWYLSTRFRLGLYSSFAFDSFGDVIFRMFGCTVLFGVGEIAYDRWLFPGRLTEPVVYEI